MGSHTMTQSLWEHQLRAIEMAREAFRQGYRFPCVVIPTGGGKTACLRRLAELTVAKGKRVVIFTNRKILTKQIGDTLANAGVSHGVMAAGHDYTPLTKMEAVKIASIQTVNSWVLDGEKHEMPEADLAIIDEMHSNTAAVAQEIYKHYPLKIGFTATPVGLKGTCDTLLIAATYSELRAQDPPKIVPCQVYAPTEVDMTGLKLIDGEYSQRAMCKRVRESKVFGDIMEHWHRLNPWKKPTLVFAPGVAESKSIVDEVFKPAGVDAAHVDGETPEWERRHIFDSFRKGNLTVISSCGVLREGFDAPAATHGILLQVCGKLSSYVQIVGRILRAHPDKTLATLQDHTGAILRHGAPDADHEWELDDDDVKAQAERKKKLDSGAEKEGIVCPECSFVRLAGPVCPQCGFQHAKSVRRVRTVDGKLVKVSGPLYKPRKAPSLESHWRSMIFRAARSGMTVKQMAGLFFHEHKVWPDKLNLKPYLFPRDPEIQKLKASHVFPWAVKKLAT